MEQSFSLEEYREMKRKKELYKKHKCRGCVWANWQQETIVLCLFPRCVKGDKLYDPRR